ncbi:Uncharacterized protein HZ326_11952 [Fusarium oxysporum f. sp. albedinis]|nr:Uncharacterized protein HZ326_11952 [Fusarium oxysporum f. sp. albedinis]
MEMDVWILTSISGSHPGFLRALTCLSASSKRRSRIRQRALSRLRGSDSLQLRDLLVEKVLCSQLGRAEMLHWDTHPSAQLQNIADVPTCICASAMAGENCTYSLQLKVT